MERASVRCPCNDLICTDAACLVAGCRLSGEAPLDACMDCGELVTFVRRLYVCDACLESYATRVLSERSPEV